MPPRSKYYCCLQLKFGEFSLHIGCIENLLEHFLEFDQIQLALALPEKYQCLLQLCTEASLNESISFQTYAI